MQGHGINNAWRIFNCKDSAWQTRSGKKLAIIIIDVLMKMWIHLRLRAKVFIIHMIEDHFMKYIEHKK